MCGGDGLLEESAVRGESIEIGRDGSGVTVTTEAIGALGRAVTVHAVAKWFRG